MSEVGIVEFHLQLAFEMVELWTGSLAVMSRPYKLSAFSDPPKKSFLSYDR